MGDLHQPFDEIREIGLTELVGINEEVNTSDFSASVSKDMTRASSAPVSGEFLSFIFFATEDDAGSVQDSAGRLIILDADPAVASGDTALAATEWVTVIGTVTVTASDWITDANGGAAYIYDQPVPFHAVSTLYFTWYHEDATDLNDGATDDEQLEFNAFYKRYS